MTDLPIQQLTVEEAELIVLSLNCFKMALENGVVRVTDGRPSEKVIKDIEIVVSKLTT